MGVLDLPNVLRFEWDKGNIGKNKKHKVENEEAEDAFYDTNRIVFTDVRHSTKLEKRYVLFGKTKQGEKLFIAFTMRGKRKEKVRIISARTLNRKEREIYEKAISAA